MKHAILAKSITLPDENKDEFIELLDIYKARFQAIDLVEERAVENMVLAEWRRRIWTFEMACLFYTSIMQEASRDEIADHYVVDMPQLHAALAFSKLADKGRTLDLFCRYEAILRREYARAYADLKELQKDRREREANLISRIEASLEYGDFHEHFPSVPTPQAKQTEPSTPKPKPLLRKAETGCKRRNGRCPAPFSLPCAIKV